MPKSKRKSNQRPKNKKKSNGGGNSNSVPSLGPVIKSAVASGLRSAGSYLGGLAGGPAGAAIGNNAGAWVSKLIGSGDYTVVENSIVRGSAHGVPSFNTGSHSMRIKHREYLGDITGSTAFSSRSYLLQPGSSVTFPWLSQIAKGFQQYRFHGLVFCFNSTSASALNSTNTALGTVIMATQYNVNRPLFTSKLEMEGYEFSCASKPSESLMHPIECDPEQLVMPSLYIRAGSTNGEDQRMYDMGKFQLATVGMQAAANIGELWVTYDVELLKPRLPPGGDFGGEYTRINNGPWDATNPLGLIQTTPRGNLGITISSNGTGWGRIFFPENLVTGRYYYHIIWTGSGTAAVTTPTLTYSNVTGSNDYFGSLATIAVPATGETTSKVSLSGIVTINGYSSAGSYVQLASSSGTLPATPVSVNIFVMELPGSDDFI